MNGSMIVVQALRRPSSTVEVFDAHGMPAAQIAGLLEANALKQHCAAARLVPSETFAAIRKMLPGVQYHAGLCISAKRRTVNSTAQLLLMQSTA